jgi:hypothetical protein
MKITAFKDTSSPQPRSTVIRYRRFGETCCLLLHGTTKAFRLSDPNLLYYALTFPLVLLLTLKLDASVTTRMLLPMYQTTLYRAPENQGLKQVLLVQIHTKSPPFVGSKFYIFLESTTTKNSSLPPSNWR